MIPTKIEFVEVEKPTPIYIVIHPERPRLQGLEGLEWKYLPEQELLALEPDQFDQYNKNNVALETYIKQLIEGWNYYEQSTRAPNDGNQ